MREVLSMDATALRTDRVIVLLDTPGLLQSLLRMLPYDRGLP
jgi:hypothetical protein